MPAAPLNADQHLSFRAESQTWCLMNALDLTLWIQGGTSDPRLQWVSLKPKLNRFHFHSIFSAFCLHFMQTYFRNELSANPRALCSYDEFVLAIKFCNKQETTELNVYKQSADFYHLSPDADCPVKEFPVGSWSSLKRTTVSFFVLTKWTQRQVWKHPMTPPGSAAADIWIYIWGN